MGILDINFDFHDLHHAYLVIGSPQDGERALHTFFLENGIKLTGSPDFFVFNSPLFGIDEARELSVAAARKAFTGKKIFLISPERITGEAQNALLKTFEDPYPNTHFFLILRNEGMVIPTLRSRMQAVHLGSAAADESDAKKFLKWPLKERLNFAKTFADKELNLSVFLDELLILLKEKNSREAIKIVYPMRLVSDDRAASARLVLEHLSTVI